MITDYNTLIFNVPWKNVVNTNCLDTQSEATFEGQINNRECKKDTSPDRIIGKLCHARMQTQKNELYQRLQEPKIKIKQI